MRISDWSSDVCSSDLEHLTDPMADDVVLEMGWGRLIFGQTFSDHAGIETALRDERLGRRDIALYMRDPHILVSRRPQDLFVDPSFTYRINLHSYRSEEHTSELQSLMRISYAVLCLKQKK